MRRKYPEGYGSVWLRSAVPAPLFAGERRFPPPGGRRQELRPALAAGLRFIRRLLPVLQPLPLLLGGCPALHGRLQSGVFFLQTPGESG